MSSETKRRIWCGWDDWQRLSDEQVGSAQTQSAFCAAHGIRVASLRNWRRRLGAPEANPEPWLELGRLAEKEVTLDAEIELGNGDARRGAGPRRHDGLQSRCLGQLRASTAITGRQLGTIVTYNCKIAAVLGGDGRQWRISPKLLSAVRDVGTHISQSKRAKRRRLR